jgi:hypothetical protein
MCIFRLCACASLLRYSAEHDIEPELLAPPAVHTVAADSESGSDASPDSRCRFVATDAKTDSAAIEVEVSANLRSPL